MRQRTWSPLQAGSTGEHKTNASSIRVHRVGVSDTVVRETKSLVITEIFDFRTTSLRGRTGRLRRSFETRYVPT